jgi:prepilin-type N-terminal cleavage/methylation domain-containing protein
VPKNAFTLIELLVVIAITAILAGLAISSIAGLNSAGNMNSATYQLKGLLEAARSYATANNTYVWVGFYEEASASPGTPGVGQIVISVVASTDGTTIYSLPLSATTAIDTTSATLLQINKLVKIDNMHFNMFPTGTGTGNSFAMRPAVGSTTQQISPGVNPSMTTFRYPLGSAAPQYTFSKAIQFSPRGEARVDNSSNSIAPVVEIGFQLTHGTIVNTASQNVAAVQITGVAGNVAIYRP